MKGQWFIISAVVASSIFFGISLMMKAYFIVDSSDQASLNGDYHFYSIVDQFNRIVATSRTDTDCVNLTMNLDEFKATIEHSLAARGLFALLDYRVTPPCTTGANVVPINFVVVNENQIIYNLTTYNIKDIIGAK